ncbi:class I SAM-dependent methyltransferase [Rhodobacter capsulatus]|nr:class I SAM-dependent methyltransferase [Rhodobacter capsulatus]WER07873.1 class I SAM-dependent methyltransferase [Rhodobacter capsulatus]
MDEQDGKVGLRRNPGQKYSLFLDELHSRMVFDWYMEIGCRAGRSFAPVAGKTIAVDPFFKAETNIIGAKPQLLIFQQTSDDFFASGMLERMGIKLSLSFLDGMHLFEYLLRDFMNTEALSNPDGVVALHDCLPFNHRMLTRDLQNLPKGPWTGDVWKLIPILRKYRPDLELTVLNCRPTGLVLVSNLDPANTVLRDNYEAIVEEWTAVDLLPYGVGRFYDCFESVDAEAFAAADYPIFAKIRQAPATIRKPTKVTK